MGNEYILVGIEGSEELFLSEMSCKFSLCFVDQWDTVDVVIGDLTPEQVVIIAKRMMIAASYFMEDGDDLLYKHNVNYGE